MKRTTMYVISLMMLVYLLVIAYKYMNSSTPLVENNTVAKTSYAPADFAWQSAQLPEKDGIPYEKISLKVKDKIYEMGQHSGCDIKVRPPTETSQITQMKCWFGGGGEELAVFNENGVYIVKERWIQESGGPGVNAEPFGPWEQLFVIQ